MRESLFIDPVLPWIHSPESSLHSCPSPTGWDFLSCFLSPAPVSFHQHPKEDSVGYRSPKVKLQFCRGDTGEAFRQILLPFPQQLLVSPPLLKGRRSLDLTHLSCECLMWFMEKKTCKRVKISFPFSASLKGPLIFTRTLSTNPHQCSRPPCWILLISVQWLLTHASSCLCLSWLTFWPCTLCTPMVQEQLLTSCLSSVYSL